MIASRYGARASSKQQTSKQQPIEYLYSLARADDEQPPGLGWLAISLLRRPDALPDVPGAKTIRLCQLAIVRSPGSPYVIAVGTECTDEEITVGIARALIEWALSERVITRAGKSEEVLVSELILPTRAVEAELRMGWNAEELALKYVCPLDIARSRIDDVQCPTSA